MTHIPGDITLIRCTDGSLRFLPAGEDLRKAVAALHAADVVWTDDRRLREYPHEADAAEKAEKLRQKNMGSKP